MTRLFSPRNPRETVLFGGPDPNRDSLSDLLETDMPKEQPTISAGSGFGVSARDTEPTHLHTVRVWFSPNGLQIMEDIKRNGLNDVVFDAIALRELSGQHQAHGITKEAFLVDLAVLKAGIPRVLGKYGITQFVPLSSDDPIILQQPAEDLGSKRALCYQYLHSKYLQEYAKRCNLAKVLGYEIHNVLKDWYEGRLEDICNRFRNLGYC
ncbi:hypothetical protein N7499_003710 [Penicillium canescens]|uniref:Uncharacterized protein n=1 Tax=Penicillium canescens TaxID=5083 RepID=A0AAD6IAI8_PENCN|nr:uncharacterized protein N7446_012661 [Penicillium canescens]KAJ6018394.1 hypothetical protein N7522_001858 [Penicillium canescens]KAJ6038849.1 hypothetical protein N7460_007566 [Penicillium canescens]KAJ6045797.1 hypothetical protein N7446_012661 [Penicillium canescens]KAJ6066381.1 hypothetical protein N7444_000134 [Penicillium canescens]KAJ6090996.1 hypothetical protein N7499_003710 [Penicillium canescens]